MELLASLLPARVGRVIDLYYKLVFAVNEQIGYVEGEGAVAARVAAGPDAVYPDLALPVNRFEMQKHGFARKLPWKLVYSDETIARYELTHQEEGFPFEYAMFAEYSVSGSTITVRYEVENRDGEVFYCGLGSHEAYRTFGGLEQCSIAFERPETLKRFILHGNLLADEYEIMGENVSCLPLKTEYFAVDALVFPYLKSREATLASNVSDKRIRVRYDGMDVLMLWTKPGADYVCIEPWTNAPDFESCDMNIEHKPGMIRLAPGANAVRRHFIEVI